ncbi:MAG: ATP-binding cassette domain-containing protein, partial [Acidobacteriaceae bacterium]|nr:ATP-binding cassette domain-containing protein [Acidobacteriaceae bacterium]
MPGLRRCNARRTRPPALRFPTEAELSTPSQTGSESPIVLTNISKLFGRFAVLRDISARFQPGHLYAIFGDNGAGKSTLLRVIAGLARASA